MSGAGRMSRERCYGSVRLAGTLAGVGVAALVFALAGGCAGNADNGSASETGAAETGAAASTGAGVEPASSGTEPGAGGEASAATVGADVGSCGERGDPITGVVCAWLADSDPGVCESMTEKLLEELYQGQTAEDSRQACEAAVAGTRVAKSVTVTSLEEREGDATVLATRVQPDNRTFVYTLALVRMDGEWLLDEVSVATGEE